MKLRLWYQVFLIRPGIKAPTHAVSSPSGKLEHSPCHLELDVGHICSYGYLSMCERVRAFVREGEGTFYVAFYIKGDTLVQCERSYLIRTESG